MWRNVDRSQLKTTKVNKHELNSLNTEGNCNSSLHCFESCINFTKWGDFYFWLSCIRKGQIKRLPRLLTVSDYSKNKWPKCVGTFSVTGL